MTVSAPSVVPPVIQDQPIVIDPISEIITYIENIGGNIIIIVTPEINNEVNDDDEDDVDAPTLVCA